MERKEGGMFLTVAILTVSVMFIGLVMSAAASTIWLGNISAPSNDYSAPILVTVPENITELRVTADTSDFQIDIHLYDPNGRHTGATYPTGEETEIPQSSYSGWNTDPEVISVMNPAPGNYTVKAYGYYKTGWANVTVTMTTAPIPGNLSHVSGQVGYLSDGTFIPLEGVNITAKWSKNGTLYKIFTHATDHNGKFCIDLPPYSQFDLIFSKGGFENYSEERVITVGPCETFDIGIIYLTKKPVIWHRLVVTAEPSSVWECENTTVLITVTDNVTGYPVSDADVSLTGCGVSASDRTNNTGQVTFTIRPTECPCDITVRAEKPDYEPGETVIHVRCCIVNYGTLHVCLINRATGKPAGSGKIVRAFDSFTKDFITENVTGDDGCTDLFIEIIDEYRVVDVKCGQPPTCTEEGVRNASEEGITIMVNETKTVYLEVTILPPECPGLNVECIPKSVEVCRDTTVLVEVTDNRTGEPVSGATVSLEGCGVSDTVSTNETGIALISIHPRCCELENIIVTASKEGYTDGRAEIDVRDRQILKVHVIDASSSDPIEGAAVDLINEITGKRSRKITDRNGDVIFYATDICCEAGTYYIYVHPPPLYVGYYEYGILLPPEVLKEKEAPLIPMI